MATTGFQLQPAGHSFRTIIDPSLLPPKKRPTTTSSAAASPSPMATTGLQLHLAAGSSRPATIQIQASLLPPKKRHSFRTIIDPSLLPPNKRAVVASPSATTTTGSQLQLATGCGLPTTTMQIQESLLPPKKRPTSSSTTTTTSAHSSSLLLVSPPMKRRMGYYAVDTGAVSCSRMAAALQQAGPAGACGAMIGSKRARKASSRYSADLWTQ